MYWMSDPSKFVRNTSVRGAASSAETAGSRGQRATSDQCAKWMNERPRSRFWTRPPVTAAASQVNRTHSDHHSGTGVSTVSGVGAMAGRRYHRSVALPLPGPASRFLGVGALQVKGSDAIASSGELPLLGRGRELDELMAAFDEARAGRGGLVLLTGDPGIGKTRLARTLGEQARAAGAVVALARGWDGGGAPSYWPWLQVLRALAAERSDERLAADLGAGARWVAQIAPEIRERLGLPDGGEAAAESDQARFALFDAVAIFLRRVAADAPVVVLLDDLHTADLPSLLLLAFLARAVAEAPVLIVSTHHEAGPKRGPEVEGVFGELSRFGRRVHLGGLETGDLRRLIAHRSGADPSDELVERLGAVTEGNPFFSDEVVRLLVSHGRVASGARLPLPDGVRRPRPRRPQPLSPEGPAALEAAAVAGRGFRVATLERAVDVPRAELLERLDEALALHLPAQGASPAGRL